MMILFYLAACFTAAVSFAGGYSEYSENFRRSSKDGQESEGKELIEKQSRLPAYRFVKQYIDRSYREEIPVMLTLSQNISLDNDPARQTLSGKINIVSKKINSNNKVWSTLSISQTISGYSGWDFENEKYLVSILGGELSLNSFVFTNTFFLGKKAKVISLFGCLKLRDRAKIFLNIFSYVYSGKINLGGAGKRKLGAFVTFEKDFNRCTLKAGITGMLLGRRTEHSGFPAGSRWAYIISNSIVFKNMAYGSMSYIVPGSFTWTLMHAENARPKQGNSPKDSIFDTSAFGFNLSFGKQARHGLTIDIDYYIIGSEFGSMNVDGASYLTSVPYTRKMQMIVEPNKQTLPSKTEHLKVAPVGTAKVLKLRGDINLAPVMTYVTQSKTSVFPDLTLYGSVSLIRNTLKNN
ncbi:MAG: hypothetical protein KAH32_01630, partial [Chlamydiia bacterium]|nr:hypothetical protein [Chlamydiia bacterium]